MSSRLRRARTPIRHRSPDPPRPVRIVEQPNQQYAYSAVDISTGKILLRHWRRDALIALCRRLGWTLDFEQTQEATGFAHMS